MKYQNYTTEDFVKDDFFVRWVKRPDAETNFFWDHWIVQHPEKVNMITQARDIVSSFNYANRYQPTQQEYVEVLENIQRYDYARKPARLFTLKGTWLKYAAVIALLVISGIALWKQHGIPNKNTPVAEVSVNFILSSTEKGQKRNLVLSDGTRIKLNSESSIKFPEKFNGSIRAVYLEGEAFFEVARDTSRPFIIHSGRLATKVLGTSFNIKAYPENEEMRVAVVTGKVQVTAIQEAQESAILLPNDMFTTNNLTKEVYIARNTDISKEIAWKDGILLYTDISLSEIITDLERWYGVKFIVEKGISKKATYSGTFDNQNLENVMMGLSYSSNFKYRIEGRKVYLYR